MIHIIGCIFALKNHIIGYILYVKNHIIGYKGSSLFWIMQIFLHKKTINPQNFMSQNTIKYRYSI